MELSLYVTEIANIYEQQHGHEPEELILQIAEHILKVGKMLTERGREDAQQGKSAYHADVFSSMVLTAFRWDLCEDHETVQTVADLWQSYYMDGYNFV